MRDRNRVFASRDRRQHVVQAAPGHLPAVSVHDIYIHPRENDIILGTTAGDVDPR